MKVNVVQLTELGLNVSLTLASSPTSSSVLAIQLHSLSASLVQSHAINQHIILTHAQMTLWEVGLLQTS